MAKKTKARKPRYIVTEVDPQLLLEVRRELFSTGLSFQRFICYMMERLSVHDERIMSILNEAREWKNKEQREDVKDLDYIYSLIERKVDDRRNEKQEGEQNEND